MTQQRRPRSRAAGSTTTTRASAPAPLEAALRAQLAGLVDGEIGDPVGALAGAIDELRRLRALAAERPALERDAAMIAHGRAEIDRLIAHALAEGQRAHGAAFDRARWERTLATLDPQTITEISDRWTAAGDALFRGGRQTVDGDGSRYPSGRSITPAFASRVAL